MYLCLISVYTTVDNTLYQAYTTSYAVHGLAMACGYALTFNRLKLHGRKYCTCMRALAAIYSTSAPLHIRVHMPILLFIGIEIVAINGHN